MEVTWRSHSPTRPPATRWHRRSTCLTALSARSSAPTARLLLGGMSNGAFYGLRKQSDRLLDEDRLRRISYLVGIFKALHIPYGEELAD